MADDKIQYEIVLKVQDDDLNSFIDALASATTGSSELDGKLEQLERTIAKQANAFRDADSSARGLSDTEKQIVESAMAADKAHKELAKSIQATFGTSAGEASKYARELNSVTRQTESLAKNQDRINQARYKNAQAQDQSLRNQQKIIQQAQDLQWGSGFDSQIKVREEQARNFSRALQASMLDEVHAAKQTEAALNSLANTRYALYDVATTLGIISAATLGTGVMAVKSAADYETLFAQIQRTAQVSGDDWDNLKDSLIDLSMQIPATIDDLARIASLAGQLNIAAEDIDSFTESVLKFSATTDVTADAAAESLGRVAQLTGVTGDQYDQLAASIYQVGITSVSTESDILSVATQISVAARGAGFATQEVIALASALASLGVQPERARGSMERIFALIQKSVDEGGENLTRFAEISGKTSEDFIAQWSTDAQGAFLGLVSGMSRAADEGQNLTSIMSDLGINAVRDVDTMKRLAQNTEVYADAIREANGGWYEGTAFAEGYAQQTDTLNASLQRLQNVIGAIVSSGIDTGPFKEFVNLLVEVGKAIQVIISTRPGRVLTGIVLTIGFVVGGIAALGAGAALAAASMAAMITALKGLNTTMNQSVGITGLLRAQIRELTVSLGYSSAATTRQAGAMGLLRSQMHAASLSAKVLRGALISTGVGAALVGATFAVERLVNWNKSAKEAEERTRALGASLREALNQDTQAGDSSFGVLQKDMEDFNDEGERTVTVAEAITGKISDTTDQLEDADSKTRQLTRSVGELSLAWLQNSILDPEAEGAFKDFNEAIDRVLGYFSLEELRSRGLDPNSLIRAIIGDPEMVRGETQAMFDALNDEVMRGQRDLDMAVRQGTATKEMVANQEALVALWNYVKQAVKANKEVSDATGEAMKRNQKEAAVLGTELNELSGDADGLGQTMTKARSAVEEFFGSGEYALSDLQSAMTSLFRTMQDNGGALSVLTEEGRTGMDALQKAVSAAAEYAGEDTGKFVAYVDAMLNQLVSLGLVAAAEVDDVRARLLGGLAGTATEGSRNAAALLAAAAAAERFGKSARKAGKDAGSAAKEIRTLTDYVNDLRSVLQSTFEYRWGLQISRDNTTKTFSDIARSIEDANQRLRDLARSASDARAELSGLAADRSLLEYQLAVSRQYGDSLGEQNILAKLEKNSADMAKAQDKLSDAQKDVAYYTDLASFKITGNSDAAIENRAHVLDLVSAYQDQIVAYANTGKTQGQIARYAETLNKRFREQARDLGLSRREVNKYAKSFSDFKTIIDRVPRNLTVSVNSNTSPAQKALNQFFAKNNNKKITNTVETRYTSTGKVPSSKEAQRNVLMAQVGAWSAFAVAAGVRMDFAKLAEALKKLSSLQSQLKNLWTGGYTGAGGKYEPKGVVHGGEYVIERERVSKLGVPFLNALGRTTERGYANGGPVNVSTSIPGVMMVELSPYDRTLLRRAGDLKVSIDGKELASSVNGFNARQSVRGSG